MVQLPTRVLSALELKLSPVMTTLLMAMLMRSLARHTAAFSIRPPNLQMGLSIVLIASGVTIAMAGVYSFRSARTTVNPYRINASSELVTDGVYRHTRNPMYVGMLLCLLGWGVYLANALALLLAALFVPYMNRFQILPEERALQDAYGERFTEYCRRVRRWI